MLTSIAGPTSDMRQHLTKLRSEVPLISRAALPGRLRVAMLPRSSLTCTLLTQEVSSVRVASVVELTVKFPFAVVAAPFSVLSVLACPCILGFSLSTLVPLLVPLVTGLQVLAVRATFSAESTLIVVTLTLQRFSDTSRVDTTRLTLKLTV